MVVSVIGVGQVATPDSASEHVKVTVALPKLTPPTGVGVTVAVMVGGVLSKLTLLQAVLEKPAASIADPQTD
jgi:hypothetical protein